MFRFLRTLSVALSVVTKYLIPIALVADVWNVFEMTIDNDTLAKIPSITICGIVLLHVMLHGDAEGHAHMPADGLMNLWESSLGPMCAQTTGGYIVHL